MRTTAPTIFVCLTVSACLPASTTVPPRPLTATEEQAVAERQDHIAGVLERQGEMADEAPQCGPFAPGVAVLTCGAPTRPTGATAEDRVRANELRDAAAQHRRVAMALESATARACAGLPEAELAESPFGHRQDIVDVEPVTGPPGPDGVTGVVGARVRFHSIERVDVGAVQHVVDCHLTMDHLLGTDVADEAYSPLAPRGATATVTALSHGYVIDVRSDDPASGREIARRALALRPPTR
jgi:hypothetical protein